jgi:hypothetical protein
MSCKRQICQLPGALGLTLAVVTALAAAPRAAAAQEDAPRVAAPAAARADSNVDFALGLSLGFLRQQGLGSELETGFIPSLLGLAYVPVAPRLFLRPGVRFGYVGLTQPPSSYGARLDEHGLQGSAELGLSYDAWLVPTLALGAGLEYRYLDFVGRGIVADSNAIDRKEWLGQFYAQAGLGLPIFRGALVVEPYARLQYTASDDRSLLQLGVDLTFEL